MQRLWKGLGNLVGRYVHKLHTPKKDPIGELFDVETRGGRLILVNALQEQSSLDQSEAFGLLKKQWEAEQAFGIVKNRLETEIQKTWEEQGTNTVLPRYVCGCDPYQPGESEIYCWDLGGEHSPYISQREVPKPGDREAEHFNSYMGGAYDFRFLVDEAPLFGFGEPNAKLLELHSQAIPKADENKHRIYKPGQSPTELSE